MKNPEINVKDICKGVGIAMARQRKEIDAAIAGKALVPPTASLILRTAAEGMAEQRKEINAMIHDQRAFFLEEIEKLRAEFTADKKAGKKRK